MCKTINMNHTEVLSISNDIYKRQRNAQSTQRQSTRREIHLQKNHFRLYVRKRWIPFFSSKRHSAKKRKNIYFVLNWNWKKSVRSFQTRFFSSSQFAFFQFKGEHFLKTFYGLFFVWPAKRNFGWMECNMVIYVRTFRKLLNDVQRFAGSVFLGWSFETTTNKQTEMPRDRNAAVELMIIRVWR